jgi:hypothetical protein
MDFDPNRKETVEDAKALLKPFSASPLFFLIGAACAITIFAMGAYEWISGANPRAYKYCGMGTFLLVLTIAGYKKTRRLERVFAAALEPDRKTKAQDATGPGDGGADPEELS